MSTFRIIATTFVLILPSLGLADTGYFCNYLLDFRSDKHAQSAEEYSLRDCKEGDVIHIHISDIADFNREQMFLADEISELCDNALPVTIVSRDRAVCTYRGGRRKIRSD